MASLRSSIGALLRHRSAAARLAASREGEFLPSSALPAARASFSASSFAAANPAASSSPPATRASPVRGILQIGVRRGGEEMARSATTGGPIRRYHALPASASGKKVPLRATRATLSSSSSSAAAAGSSKACRQQAEYDPVFGALSVEAAIREVEELLSWRNRGPIVVAKVALVGVLAVGFVMEYNTYRDLQALKRAIDKLEEQEEAEECEA